MKDLAAEIILRLKVLIEVSGTVLTREAIPIENYAQALKECAGIGRIDLNHEAHEEVGGNILCKAVQSAA